MGLRSLPGRRGAGTSHDHPPADVSPRPGPGPILIAATPADTGPEASLHRSPAPATSPTGAPGPVTVIPPDPLTLRDLIRSDFEATCAIDPTRPRGPGRTLDVLSQPGFLALALYRVGAAVHRRGHRMLARLLLNLNVVVFNCEIYPQVRMGPGCSITHPLGVAIGAGTVIGRDVRIHGLVRIGTAGHEDGRPDGFPVIGDGARLFDHCMLFGPIEIGAGARVGANALVLRSVPAGASVRAPLGELHTPVGRRPTDP